MEPIEIIVARLVLGYLKNEHCRSAYKAFLGNSRHFHNNSQTKDKYFHTRFVGLTLEDILNEYFEIYHIVQGRLEATSYFNEKHSRPSLRNQLLYLLNKGPLNKGPSISRTSTPCPRSPVDSHLDETSPSYQDPNSDVETTPAHTLPGNIRCSQEETYLQKTPRRKYKTTGSPGDSEEMAEAAIDPEVLAQTLLENREFTEKIAQTINKVAEKQHMVSAGLDIKTVMKETEEDPMFDKILEEIIGSTNFMDNHAKFETNSTASSIAHSSSEVLDNRLNKSNKKTDVCDTSQAVMPTEIEVQNNEAIQSIVDNSLTVSIPINREQINNEIVVFDGSLDKYLVNTGCSIVTAPIKNQVYFNTMGLLVPTNVQQGLKTTTDKQYFISNPQGNWNVPLDTVRNQDILSMPTVIVNEKKKSEKRPCGGQKKVPKPSKPQQIPEILPKATIESVVLLNLPSQPTTVPSQPESTMLLGIPESANPTGLKKVIYPKVTNSSLNDCPQPPVVSNQPLSASTPANSKVPNDLPEIMTEKEEANLRRETDKINKTPPPSENVQKVTPKSASHIRNLDFSTPPKISPSCKKSRRKASKSPIKKQAAKSLFKEVLPANKVAKKTWDSDLRAVVSHTNSKNIDTPRRVTNKNATMKSRKKVKINEKPDANTTEEDAAKLEAALQSPIIVVDKSAEDENTQKNVTAESTKSVDKSSEEISLEVKNENNTTSNQCKTILSPSKLNASKRNLLEPEGDGKSKYITPENTKENITHPIKANRNIMPFLETPLKDYVPITPGIQTPMDLNVSAMSSNMTPFTKMLEANLGGIDINQLPTPNIPITPNFPERTPIIDLVSPFSNRPTDYSTSSSYYQPSDNEQNKSLEAHLFEMEKKTLVDKVETKTPHTNEHLNHFNKNIVGKKNLNLVKRDIASSSSSSDESGTDSNTDTNTDSDTDSDSSDSSGVDNKESNDTVIFKKIEPVYPLKNYSLRLRNASGKVQKEPDKKDLMKMDEDSIVKKVNPKPVKSGVKKIKEIQEIESEEGHEKDKLSTCKKKVEQTTELEEKRLEKDKLSTSKNEVEEKSLKQKSVTSELEEKRLEKDKLSTSKNKVKEKSLKQKSVTTELEEKRLKKDKLSTSKNKVEEKSLKQKSVTTELEEKRLEKDKLSTSKNKVEEKSLKQKSVTKELEEKRLRVMNQLKNNNTNKPKQQTKKFMKIKSLVHINDKKRARKAVMPKKILTPKKEDMRTILMHDLAHSDDSDWDVPLKSSPNAKTAKKMRTRRLSEKNDESFSDVEAQNLIEGLKQRGIHLMHNKSPKKKVKDAPQVTEKPSSPPVENKTLDTSNNEKILADRHSFIATEIRDSYDIQVFPEETISLVYDEKNTSQRTFEDYNASSIIEKTMKTEVFVEEVNLYMDIYLKVSEFHSLLQIDPNKDEVLERIVGGDMMRVNEDDKINDQSIRSVPEESDTDNQVIDTIKLDNNIKQVTIIASANEDKKLPDILTEESKQITKETKQPKSKQIVVIENKCIYKPKPILNEETCEESESAKENITKGTNCPQETSTTETARTIDPADEDLMNFAVLGSDKEEAVDHSMSRKRKGRMVESTQSVKKQNNVNFEETRCRRIP